MRLLSPKQPETCPFSQLVNAPGSCPAFVGLLLYLFVVVVF